MSKIDALAEGAGKLLSAVPDLYTDLAKPVVQETGKVLSFPIELIQALLARPRCWIANANYKLQETNALIAKKLEKINSAEIKAPEDYIAVPALQALSYSMDSEELRNLYANLLAKSMCSDTTAKVHPAYVEIIKQLDPLDCHVFEYIFKNDLTLATSAVYVRNPGKHSAVEYSEVITEIDFADVKTISASLDNLKRLGLLQEGQELLENELYKRIHENAQVKEFCEKIALNDITNPKEEKIDYKNKRVSITDFGELFYDVCCKDIDE